MFGRFNLLSILTLAASAISAAVSMFVDFALSVLASPITTPAGWPRGALQASGGGSVGISPALFNSNRHEAGVSRRSAARNT